MATLKQEKNKKSKKSDIEKKEMLELFKQMYLIRQFELACGENYTKGNIRGFLHLYIGQEATAVGSISCLNDEDYIITHYRDHGHALARGLDVNRSMSELFGKKTGLSKGKGGSMHIADMGLGHLGANAIVGGGIPTVVGAGLSYKLLKKPNVSIAFFGPTR